MLLPALIKGRSKVQDVSCKNNLKQQALGMTLYVSDYSVYPIHMAFINQVYQSSWTEGIAPYLTKNTEQSVFTCPAFRNAIPNETYDNSYGYNTSGVERWGYSGTQLGLAEMYLPRPYMFPMSADDIIQTKETMIRKPDDMIEIGDAVILASSVENGQPFGNKDLSVGLWLGRLYYTPVDPSDKTEINSKNAVMKRHNGKFNIIFCDSHLESLSPKIFNVNNDATLRRWNNDNQPHREGYYASSMPDTNIQ